MNFFTVDVHKCILCGRCLGECPFHLLEMKNKDTFPTPRAIEFRSAEERCIGCGHCVVVCPTSALTLEARIRAGRKMAKQGPQVCPPIRPELKVNPEQVAQLLMARRTCRSYHDKSVPRETLKKIIQVARYAPSGHNRQAVKWLVINDGEEMKHIGQTVIDWMRSISEENQKFYHQGDFDVIVDMWDKGEDSIFRGATHLVILYGAKGLTGVAEKAFAIRMAYFELAAIPYGLGTVWCGYFLAALQSWNPTVKAVGLSASEQVYDAMGIGYPKNMYRRIPVRNEPSVIWR